MQPVRRNFHEERVAILRNPLLYSLLFLILLSSVAAITPLDARSMDARVLITNTVNFNPEGSRYRVDDATGTLSWYPRQTWLQEVQSVTVDPQAQQTDNAYIFHWTNPPQTNQITLTSIVKTKNTIIPVRDKVQFPLQDIPTDVVPYLEAGEITDQTPEIQALAQQLAVGKSDAYEVVYALADWTTRNVNYSLASVGQPAIQKSSEVLQSRYGKCDELTALFISLNRAVGIPARFVAGYSYTNSKEFSSAWGGHGWAEVWLPDQGWIPFDVTYGEYGYLDAGHITLKVAPDAKETSIDYSARGNQFDISTKPLDITVTPLQMNAGENNDISITLDAPHKTVGFGSAVLILATVTNKRDYYVSTRLDLAKTSNTDMLSATYENILLHPYESKVLPFLVKLDDNLQAGYTYSFPFRLYSRLGPEGTITITSQEAAPIYDQSAFDEYLQPPEATASFSVACDHGNVAYVGTPVTHNCILQHTNSAQICDPKCHTVTGAFTITTTDAKQGVFTRTYTATANGEQTKFFVTSRSVDQTTLRAALSAPEFATPSDTITVALNLSQTGALAKDVNVTLHVNHEQADQHLDDLSRPAVLQFTASARSLRPGDNTLVADIAYTDELGNSHTAQATAKSTLTNVSVMDRIDFFLEDVGYWVTGLIT